MARGGRCRYRIPAGTRDFLLSETSSSALRLTHLMGPMGSLPGKPSPGVRVIIHLDLVQRWRVNVALPGLP